jgi:hypothetical protein
MCVAEGQSLGFSFCIPGVVDICLSLDYMHVCIVSSRFSFFFLIFFLYLFVADYVHVCIVSSRFFFFDICLSLTICMFAL